MGYKEAIEDGIKKTGSYYNIPCCVCNKALVTSASYSRDKKYICKTCKKISEGRKDPGQVINKEIKFQNAVSRLEVLVDNFDAYKEAIEKIRKTLHHVGWYRSTEEIMVAIELLQKGVKTIHQQKVGKYSVDFVLPDFKVLLEIDGKPFHNNHTLAREGERDGTILLKMGVDWEIVRIDTDKINKDIQKLLPSIEAILEYRKAEKRRLHKA